MQNLVKVGTSTILVYIGNDSVFAVIFIVDQE